MLDPSSDSPPSVLPTEASNITMQHPECEVESVVQILTCNESPDIQKATIQRYFTSDAGFKHPLCYVPPAYNSREDILGVYQWYRILSPHIQVEVREVAYIPEQNIMFLDIVQKFHIRWNIFPPAPARLLVHLKLREENGLYYIAYQEDYYHPDEMLALTIPPLVMPARMVLRAGAFASNVLARFSQLVFGVWLPRRTGGNGPSCKGGGDE